MRSAVPPRLSPRTAERGPGLASRRTGSDLERKFCASSIRHGVRHPLSLLIVGSLAWLTGCAVGTFDKTASTVTPVTASKTASGSVHGGQQPVSGSTVQLWQVGTTGYGAGAAALGAPATTDTNGNFTLTGNYSCSNAANGPASLVYLTATGGNPGIVTSGTGTNNSALVMMAALGPCSSLTPSTFTNINEVTTVASVYALAQFMSPSGSVGSYSSSTQGLSNAFTTVSNLVSTSTGQAFALTPNGNGVVPQAEINTLANILSSCVNSTGPSSNGCTALFAATTPAAGPAPTTTLGAILNIALNPGSKVTTVLGLAPPAAPFQPTVTAANDWTMAIGYASGGSAPRSVASDSSGNIWIANFGTGGSTSTLSLLSPLGVPASGSPYASPTYVNGASGLAIDLGNNVYLANHDSNSIAQFNATVTAGVLGIHPAASNSSVGLNGPVAIAVDPSANLWVANNAGNSVTEIPPSCVSTTCATSFTGGGLSAPQSIAIDSSGNAWVANNSGASVTRIIPATGPSPYTGGGLANPAALAIDGSTNIWVTDSGLAQLSELNSNGAPLSPGTGITAGGLTSSSAVAIDGAGNVWIADSGANQLSEFNSSGTALTGATGYQGGALSGASALTIDLSGNLWITNSSPVTTGGVTVTLSEFIGLAAPSIAPLAQAVKLGQLGQEPGAPPAVKLPKANAGGPYSGTSGIAVSFTGANSTDPLDQTLTYLWSFGDGAGASGANPSHTYLTAGTYAVKLTVTDVSGNQSTASTSVTIAPTNVVAPIANISGPFTGTAFNALTLSGIQSSDPANTGAGASALSFTWNFGDGTTGAGPTPVHTYTTSGTFNVSLTVQSIATGATASATSTATIAAGSQQAGTPTANAGGPYNGTAGTAINFSSNGSSDPNGLALTYTWTFGDGGSSTSQNPAYTYAKGGTYSVTLNVSNGSTDATVSTVATVASLPVAALVASTGGPYSANINQPVAMSAAATTNPTQRQLSYTWDFGDGTTGSGVNVVHVYSKGGNFTVNLSVNDGLSASGNASTTATIAGAATETVTASIGGPYGSVINQPITFNAAASTDNLLNDLTYSWTFGDGGTATGVTPTHTYTTAGNYTVALTATSTAASAASATSTTSVPITVPITVAITSPLPNAITSTPTATITGTISNPNATVTVNGMAANVSGNNFTVAGVSLREGVNLISATANDTSGDIGTGVVSVILDTTPPLVSITSPSAGATISASSIAVAGLVNDSTTGTVSSNNMTVTVNGQVAQVSNRSYLLPNLQLVPGLNTITVVATDSVGNSAKTTTSVTLLPPNSQLTLNKVSGDAQTGSVHSVLSSPLVVQLTSASGTPVAGRPVTFTVSRSDGMMEVLPTIAQSISVTTDATGKASALLQLGSRSGLGINQVTASTPGAPATTFTATSTIGTAAKIVEVRGDNQRGLLGQPLAESFMVMVKDNYGNPVPGVTVNFTSIGATDGALDNASPITDSNGKANATLTMGQQEGINNYAYTADFANDSTGTPVSFVASAYSPGPVASTSVSGTVLDNSNMPVPNATVTISGTNLSTVTNSTGNFTINGAPVGTVTLTVDGSTATLAETLPFLSFVLQDLPGQNNTLGKPIYLPAINATAAQTVGSSEPVTLTMAGVPGLAFTIAPNSVTFPDGSTVGQMSLSQVKSDLIPMEPSNGTVPGIVWTLQPAGTKFSVPVQVTMPNTQGLAPGKVTEIFQYDHDLEQFVSIGTGTVSADGSVINSDPGFGITKAGWGHCCTDDEPDDCAESCNPGNVCVNIFAVPGCDCGSSFNDGVTCYGTATNQTQCHLQGTCRHGLCTGKNKPDGTECTDGNYCDKPACKGGVCEPNPIPDTPQMPTKDGSPATSALEVNIDSISDGMKTFFNKFYIPFTIVPVFNVSSQTTLKCCEAKQMMNVPSTTDTIQIGIKMTTKDLIPIIAGVPLAFNFPSWFPGEPGPQGITIAFDGGIFGNGMGTVNMCDNSTCYSGGPSVQINGKGQFTFGYQSYAFIYGNVNSGITGSLTFGCGQVEGKIQWNGIVAEYGATLGTYVTKKYTTQLVQPYVVIDEVVPF